MKTLDEVIKKIEACIEADGHCPACPYEVSESCGDMDADALHYLKQYKDLQYGYIKAMADLEDNPPLTWDELKAMTGKPVFVEALLYKQWAVIGYVGEDYIRFEGVNLYAPESRTYMGAEDGWQAYRKERK